MIHKKNGLSLIFDHNCMEIITDIEDEEAFEYIKAELSKKYPELKAMDVDSDTEWLEQVVQILKIDYDKLVFEIEKQMLKSYFLDKTYQELVTMLNDPHVPMSEKERLTKLPLRSIIAERRLRVLVYGLWRAFVNSAIIGLLSFSVAFPIWFLLHILSGMPVPPLLLAVVFGMSTFLFSSKLYFTKEHTTFSDKAFSKLLRR